MLRKLRPLEKRLSTVFSLKSKRIQRSIKSFKSGHSRQDENQQVPTIIPDDTSTQETPLSIRNVDGASSIQEEPEGFQQNSLCEHQNELSMDSLARRYHRALNDNDPSTSNITGTTQEDNPLMTAAIGSSSSSSETNFDWNQTDESELDESERQARDQRKWRELQGRREHQHIVPHAKRLRRFYYFLMKLSSPVRTIVIGLLGTSISVTSHILAWSIWLSVSFAASCATAMIVDILPSVVINLVDLSYGSRLESLNTQVELWMNVRYWTKLVLGFASYWVTLSVMFSRIFRLREDPHLDYFHWVKKVTAGSFTAGLVLLFEKILLQVIQLNFHRTGLKVRLEENEQALRALDQLADANTVTNSSKKRNSKFPISKGNSQRTKKSIRTPPTKDSTIVDVSLTPKDSNINHSSGGKHKTEKRRTSTNILMFADQLTSALNSVLKKGNGTAEGMLSSTHSARKLAKKLFEGLDKEQKGAITLGEFEPCFKTINDAVMAFKLFDKDGNGDIDRKEMRNAVVKIYKERRALAIGLKDMSSAVSKLDAVLISAACLLTIFVWFFILNPKATSLQLAPMATIILGFSFIFGNAAKNLFESMLFIFSIHPYDVGDLVFIEGIYMFVMEFGLFSTTFQQVDGKVVVAPNSQLIGKKHITNIRRSGPMWETTTVMVGFDTPLETLHEFRARLRQWVIDNPREWKGGLDVNIDFIHNQNLIQLLVAMEHISNWQDWDARWERRTSFMKAMKRIMDSLNITYKLPPQPISFLPGKSGRHNLHSGQEESLSRPRHPTGGTASLFSRRTASHTSNPLRSSQNGFSLTSHRLW
ncbi:hypothetical protein PGTUg99_014790 [Puccinia graminis f. sp. tritici]|uniref:EF-hand domain-containing protein n=1 Tax=Puccinia graminis f. sp. tritici TaxID=56615 RepID=A0A5B0N7J2_PUCGR|nr:hypothetical protein PGTUg99_014790 [Puccinia graminis f. sp. tritici]